MRPKFYESASVAAVYYPLASIPDEDSLVGDLRAFVACYERLAVDEEVRALFGGAMQRSPQTGRPPMSPRRRTQTVGDTSIFEVVARLEGDSLRVCRTSDDECGNVRIGWYRHAEDVRQLVLGDHVDVPRELVPGLLKALQGVGD